ncbi:MAG: hypothetical protein M1825_005545 [Sarcosagium campestre]|nr:MAG: hypothetical protein M1825_005545 [Sarcosagium campestre]
MSGRINYEEHFKFLLSCIRHSSAGKVDFGKVSTECDIVSKGAAAKRYERLMKAHGIHGSAETAGTASPETSPVKNTGTKKPKKRKIEDSEEVKEEKEVKEEVSTSRIDITSINKSSSMPQSGIHSKKEVHFESASEDNGLSKKRQKSQAGSKNRGKKPKIETDAEDGILHVVESTTA